MTQPVIGLIWKLENPIQRHAQRRRAEVTAVLLQPHRSDLILDVGCGDGYQISFVIKSHSDVIGLDASLNKLREAKRRVPEADFICGSCEKLPFRPQVFNKVVCLELLEHLENPPKTLSEIDLVLKSRGILIVSAPYRERIFMSRCIHCGKLTPHWGHLHSFNEEKMSSLLPRNYVLLHREYVCTWVASYLLFSSLPTQLWKIFDSLSRLLPGVKPSWFINKIQKV